MSTLNWINAQESTLIYIGDPMCSWCYGFAPEITELKENNDSLEFKLILGGLRPGGTENLGELGDFLEHHWKEVHERSGQPFNYGIIGDSTFLLDTEPGCRAVVAARTLKDSIDDLAFFKAVQHAFFVENKSMVADETFAEIAEDFGLEKETFLKEYNSEECRYNTRADFQLSAEMGVRGFPSMVMKHKGQFFLIANGYQKSENIQKIIDKILTEDN